MSETPVEEEPQALAETSGPPSQAEMPFAVVQGVPLSEPPRDLYIPPEALEVFLEAFEGPLDLLLYLIKRQNLDILDIPIARVTEQYMTYIGLMQEMKFELAAEYLLMAAMLAEIKSRMLRGSRRTWWLRNISARLSTSARAVSSSRRSTGGSS